MAMGTVRAMIFSNSHDVKSRRPILEGFYATLEPGARMARFAFKNIEE